MLKKFSVPLILFYIFLTSSLWRIKPCFASGDATHCIITVKKVWLKNVSGDWVSVDLPEHQVDLTQEEPIFSFVNYKKVPRGKYVNFKVVISETLKVSGKDGRNMTKAGGEITVGGTAATIADLPGDITSLAATSPTWNDKEEGLITEHLNLDFEDRNDTMEIYPRRDFNKPFVIKEGSGVHLWLTVSLSHTIYFMFPNAIRKNVPTQYVMYFIPPKEVDDMSIVVDSSTSFAPGDLVVWDF